MENKLALNKNNGVFYYTSSRFSSGVKHFFSTKIGGVSTMDYSSLNLGVYTEDKGENIQENFRRIFNENEMNLEKVIYLRQVHGNDFYVVDNKNYKDIKNKSGDGLITKSKNIAIGVFTADCVPILIEDKLSKTIAAIHAGWKGTYLRIVERVIKYMIENMDCNPNNMIVALGPSIGPCCFEVGVELKDKFKYISEVNNRFYVDLWSENYSQAVGCNIPKENIISGELCTMCQRALFYSYRRDNGNTGRLGSFIQLSKEG